MVFFIDLIEVYSNRRWEHYRLKQKTWKHHFWFFQACLTLTGKSVRKNYFTHVVKSSITCLLCVVHVMKSSTYIHLSLLLSFIVCLTTLKSASQHSSLPHNTQVCLTTLKSASQHSSLPHNTQVSAALFLFGIFLPHSSSLLLQSATETATAIVCCHSKVRLQVLEATATALRTFSFPVNGWSVTL